MYNVIIPQLKLNVKLNISRRKDERMKTVKTGLIGMGARGFSLTKDLLTELDTVKITAVCDVYQDRAEQAAKLVAEKRGYTPAAVTDYRDVLANDEVEAVVIMASWESHIDIAVAAMEAKKTVALEVGGAYSVDDCIKLVDAYEKTGTPFMFMENCCFGRREMMCLNMERSGVFGEVVHCSGRYGHDLREEIANGKENRHYRLRNYKNRNCENYPTHELGPIAKLLRINAGNRMVSLTSTASKSAGLKEYINRNKSDDTELMNTDFKQGDIVTTVITCAGGETIVLTLDTTLPRYYSRGLTVRGTKAMYDGFTDSVFTDCETDRAKDHEWKSEYGNSEKYAEKYEHPLWQSYLQSGVQGSHDGMDYLEFNIFFDAVINNKPMPIDVYDAAAWMAITPLSEQSIACGSTPVAIPDFTRGKWMLKKSFKFDNISL